MLVSCSLCMMTTIQNQHVSFGTHRSACFNILSEGCLTLILLGHQTCSQTNVMMTHNKFQILIIYGLLMCHLDQLPE